MQYPHDIMLKTYTLQYWQYINFCINRKEKKTHHLTIQARKINLWMQYLQWTQVSFG